MKNIFLSFTLLLLSIGVFAQKGSWSLQAGCSAPSYSDIVLAHSGYEPNHITIGGNLQANYFLMDMFSLGLAVNRSNSTTRPVQVMEQGQNGRWDNVFSYTVDLTMTTVILFAEVHYPNNGRWDLSSSVGAGYSTVIAKPMVTGATDAMQTVTCGMKAWQLNVLTAKYYCCNNLGVYAGFGAGFNGALTLGAVGRF